MAVDFLSVGHIVKDLVPDGWRLGGSVAYASLTAHRLGLITAAVTRCSPDLSPPELLPHTRWHVLPDDHTTTFENIYIEHQRQQRLIETALSIGPTQVPESWRNTPIVFLAPVFQELEARLASIFPPECLVGLGAQGWLRRVEAGRVLPGAVDPAAQWLIGDIVFVSEEDLIAPEESAAWVACVPMVVLTRGPRGFTVFDDNGRHEFPAMTASEVDPTGAGDVFATAFLIRWKETGNLAETARFAAAAGALAVQGVGVEAIPTRAQIESALGAWTPSPASSSTSPGATNRTFAGKKSR